MKSAVTLLLCLALGLTVSAFDHEAALRKLGPLTPEEFEAKWTDDDILAAYHPKDLYKAVARDIARLKGDLEGMDTSDMDLDKEDRIADIMPHNKESFLEVDDEGYMYNPDVRESESESDEIGRDLTPEEQRDLQNARDIFKSTSGKSVKVEGFKDEAILKMWIPREECSRGLPVVSAYSKIIYESATALRQGDKFGAPTARSECINRVVGRYEALRGLLDIQAYMVVDDNDKIVTFIPRATEPKKIQDWMTNFNFLKSKCDYSWSGNRFTGDTLIAARTQAKWPGWLDKAAAKVKSKVKSGWESTKKAVKSGWESTKKVVKKVVTHIKNWIAPEGKCGRIHRGFKKGWAAIRNQVHSTILTGRYVENGYKFVIAGHSQGGALATLAAVDFKERWPSMKLAVYTFGSPRVGNKKFVKYYNRLVPHTLRYVNRYRDGYCPGSGTAPWKVDLVARIPPEFLGYRHVGGLKETDCTRSCKSQCCKNNFMTSITCHTDYLDVLLKGFLHKIGNNYEYFKSRYPMDWSKFSRHVLGVQNAASGQLAQREPQYMQKQEQNMQQAVQTAELAGVTTGSVDESACHALGGQCVRPYTCTGGYNTGVKGLCHGHGKEHTCCMTKCRAKHQQNGRCVAGGVRNCPSGRVDHYLCPGRGTKCCLR
eukprot:TRINITY_DN2111_c0_g2_i2.p2 TRINITY_DN2111_c0_g2~~TRINITY_DN2111_c0_g2_i2.p2  ORF type:complete len:654 (-),score=182.80 TRINITY_DN2111_c0_g2_i2:2312-4273(-)